MKKLYAILVSALILIVMGGDAYAQKAEKEKRDKLQKDIALLQDQVKSLNAQSADATAKLTVLQKQISARKSLLKESERQVQLLDRQISDKKKQIRNNQVQLDTMRARYARLIKVAYKTRDARVWYMYLLSSRNLNQATRRLDYLKNISSQMDFQVREMLDMAQALLDQQEELEGLRAEAKTVRDEHEAELSAIKKDEAHAQQIVSDLNKSKTKYQKQIEEKRKQVKALDDIVAKAAAQNSSKKSSSGKKVSNKNNKNLGTSTSDIAKKKGQLPWPVEGVVVESFGQHYHPVYKTVKLPFNNGVNIATAKNAKVTAVYNGEVRQVIVMPGYGKCVLVQHGDFFSFYCKLGTVDVKAGDKIKTGQTVGTVDTIGGQTQLHFQFWQEKTPQDPEKWLSK